MKSDDGKKLVAGIAVIFAISKSPVASVSTLIYMIPVVAFVLGWLMLGE